MEIYSIKDLDHFYGNSRVLAIDNVAISSASITGLIGPNGSGKSTLLKLLGFLDQPTYGTILFKGKQVAPYSEAVRFRITLLPQEPYLMHRSVFDNVVYGLKIRKDTKNWRKRVAESLNQVGLEPDRFASRNWSALSGGEAQRVALASRLILRPEVLLLDEPTASVDTNSARLIREASLQAKEDWGATLVVATHDWQWLYETCDTVLHLLHGRLFKSGLGCTVYGPWRTGLNGMLQKELADGQVLFAPKPEEGKRMAVLDPVQLKITLPGKDLYLQSNMNVLRGFITRLFLEKNGDMVQASVKAAELVVTLRLDRGQVESLKLLPGSEVCIWYDYKKIDWF